MRDQLAMKWFALRVAPQKEFDVQRQLNQKEIPAIVPREVKWRITPKRHRVKREYPLFARYVFAGFVRDLAVELRAIAIEEIQGVICRSRNEWSPLVLSKADLATLQEVDARGAAMTSIDIHKALKPGGQARVILGPFAGQTVKIDRISARKARVLLNILNSMHVVTIPVMALDAA